MDGSTASRRQPFGAMRWLWAERLVGPPGRWVVLGLLVLARSGLAVLPPLLLGAFIDDALGQRRLDLLWLLGLAWLAVPAASSLLGAFRTRLQSHLVAEVQVLLRQRTFEQVLKTDLAAIEERQAGEAAERLTASAERASSMVFSLVGTGVPDVVTLVLALAVVFALDWRLGAVLLVAAAAQVPSACRAAALFQQETPRWLAVRERLTARVVEAVSSLPAVRALRAEPALLDEHGRLLGRFRQIYASALTAGGWFGAQRSVLTAVSVAAVLVAGGYQVLSGALSVGTLVAFFTYAVMLEQPLSWIGAAWGDLLPELGAELDRLREYYALPQEADGPEARSLDTVRGAVSFEGVTFRRGGRAVLDDVGLAVAPGEFAAIVGPTGAGKSTLLRLLLGLYAPDGGTIRLDGVPLAGIRRASLRQHVAWLPQEPFVLHGSVRENLLLADPGAGDGELSAACEAAGLGPVLATLPGGMDAAVTEAGRSLSGGERQRLALARLLLAKPAVALLDEMAAHLDPETERAVLRAVRRRLAGRTLIAVSHRLASVADADRIVVLRGGRVEAVGRHEELLETSPTYHALWSAQTLG